MTRQKLTVRKVALASDNTHTLPPLCPLLPWRRNNIILGGDGAASVGGYLVKVLPAPILDLYVFFSG